MTVPRLSVIVPTYNRAPVLAKCLEALARQDCGDDLFEVIVSDDGSTDDTRAVVASFAGAAGVRVRYLHQPNAGANAARNRAIDEARAPLLLLINDDTIPTPWMLRAHLQAHDEHPDDRVAVLGRVTVSPDVAPSRLAPLHLDRAFAALGDGREFDWRAFFTCNVSLKRSLIERGGRFEERMRYHEDLELAERLSHHGLRVIYRPDALGYHEHSLTEEELYRIAAREARSLVVWATISPGVVPTLASLGFEPALPLTRRLKHRVADLVMNRGTLWLWRAVARHCPVDSISLAIYDQTYQCVKRAHLRRELRQQRSAHVAPPPAPAAGGGDGDGHRSSAVDADAPGGSASRHAADGDTQAAFRIRVVPGARR